MLKSIDPLLNADVLYALRAMGHGDEAHHLRYQFSGGILVAHETVLGQLLRIDASAARVARGCAFGDAARQLCRQAGGAHWKSSASPLKIPPVQAEGAASGDRQGRGKILAHGLHRALCLLDDRAEEGLLRDPVGGPAVLRLLRVQERRHSSGRAMSKPRIAIFCNFRGGRWPSAPSACR